MTSMYVNCSSLLTRAGRLEVLWRFSNMKEESEGGSSSGIEDTGLLGAGLEQYLLLSGELLLMMVCRSLIPPTTPLILAL